MTGAVPEMARPATKPTRPLLRWHGRQVKACTLDDAVLPRTPDSPFGGAGSAPIFRRRSPANKYDLKHRMYHHELTVDDHHELMAFLRALQGCEVLAGQAQGGLSG
jgi:hypothetical protein